MKTVTILKSRLSHLGGLERYAKAIAIAFVKKGHKVTILTTGENVKVEGVQVQSLGPHPKSTWSSILFFEKRVSKWLKANPQDIVFGLDRNSFQTHYRAGNGLHHTFLKQRSASFFNYWLKRLSLKSSMILKSEKKLFENTSLKLLFANSNMVKKELLALYKIPSDKIEVVHNGVDLSKLNFNPSSKKEALEKLNLPHSKIQLLFVGNNYKRKGLSYVLEALSKLSSKDFSLIIVGEDKNISKYQKMSKKLNLDSQTFFFGHRQDLNLFYCAADILILPSFYDPFANVTIEALAMGLFVITSSFNGGSEVLTKNTGAILKDFRNPCEIADVLEKLASKDFDYDQKLETKKTIQHLELKPQLDRIVDLTIKSST